jgi:hypothetical protein
MSCYVQTDGQTDMAKLIAVFLQVIVKPPKIFIMKVIIIIIKQYGNII